MKEEKFKILQFIREFIVRVENELENFPKKDIEIKKRIKDISYELLELVYRANLLEEPKEKKNLLIKAIAKVKIIDFLINLSYDRELLPQKRYIKLSEKLDDIVKYIKERAMPNDIVLTLGAGTVTNIGPMLLQQ